MQKTLSIIIAVFSISFYACNSKHSGGEVKIENDGPKWSSLGAKNNLKIGKQGWLEGKQENIDAFIVYKDELYVGGNFTNSFGLTGNYIAKWNGSKWSAVGNGVDGGVGALIIYNDELYGN